MNIQYPTAVAKRRQALARLKQWLKGMATNTQYPRIEFTHKWVHIVKY